MKRYLLGLIILSIAFPALAGPRSHGNTGTASTTCTGACPWTVSDDNSVNFNPKTICIKNTGATNNLIVNWQNPSAVATTNLKGNLSIAPGDTLCYTQTTLNVLNTFTYGLISAAATTTYNVNAVSQ